MAGEFSRYGVGAKVASFFLGNHVEITSKFSNENFRSTLVVDLVPSCVCARSLFLRADAPRTRCENKRGGWRSCRKR
jgi:hypothetical protein